MSLGTIIMQSRECTARAEIVAQLSTFELDKAWNAGSMETDTA